LVSEKKNAKSRDSQQKCRCDYHRRPPCRSVNHNVQSAGSFIPNSVRIADIQVKAIAARRQHRIIYKSCGSTIDPIRIASQQSKTHARLIRRSEIRGIVVNL
jgi:hypothetical protein